MAVHICPDKLSDFRKSNNWSVKAIEHTLTLDRLRLLFSTKLNEESR